MTSMASEAGRGRSRCGHGGLGLLPGERGTPSSGFGFCVSRGERGVRRQDHGAGESDAGGAPPQALSSRVPASNSGSALAIGLQRGKKASPTILMLSLKLPGPAGQRGRRREEGRGGSSVPGGGSSSSSGQGEGRGRGQRQGGQSGVCREGRSR